MVFSDDAHIRMLNAGWRGKDKPTNVLSFPAFPTKPGEKLPPMLGDIVLAAETVAREAELEGKPLDHHITHLVVHGVLHLARPRPRGRERRRRRWKRWSGPLLRGLPFPIPTRNRKWKPTGRR